jgi:hypothetical protein
MLRRPLVQFSGHALDEMQSDGVMPSAVIDAMKYGETAVGSSSWVAFSPKNNLSVVLSYSNTVITVTRGFTKPH